MLLPLVGTGLLLAGCTVLVANKLSDKPSENALTTTNSGGGATAGTGGTGANGGSGGCAQDPTPPGGDCPSECTGGCVDNVCGIDCGDDRPCTNASLLCPTNFACRVDCGYQGCMNAKLTCPGAYGCEVNCADYQSCKQLELNCGAGSCTVNCINGNETCAQSRVNCGAGPCTATCQISTPNPGMTCGSSCACSNCS